MVSSVTPYRRWLPAGVGTALFAAACGGVVDAPVTPVAPAAPRLDVSAAALPPVRISEIHYDDLSTDNDEAVEVSFPVGTDLTGWKIVRFNGATPGAATAYTGSVAAGSSETLSALTPTTCTNGTRAVVVVRYNTDGLQNGSNDGVALVNGSTVVELLSYEGVFTVAAGQAVGAGMTSTDIGVSESNSTTLEGQSLQRTGAGDNTWNAPAANTFGACNDDGGGTTVGPLDHVTVSGPTTVNVGTSITLTALAEDAAGNDITGGTVTWSDGGSPNVTVTPTSADGRTATVTGDAAGGPVTITASLTVDAVTKSGTHDVTVSATAPSATNVRVSEFHYDNEGVDAGEAIEVEGDAGGSLAGWSLVLYSGTPGSATLGQSYATIALSGTFGAACSGGTRGVLSFAATGLQNGSNDGFALVNNAGQVVEFLSYEGSFQATNGPAAGMTATDVGVDEDPAPPADPVRSLQRAGNGVWFGPTTSTFGQCNAATPPEVQKHIEFGTRLPSDGRLLVGYQGELFPRVVDENGTTIPSTFTFASETPSVATINANGVLTTLTPGTATFRATAADGTTGTITFPTENPPLGNAALYKDPLTFGTPTDATPADEFRITRSQYTVSYNGAKGEPNWVAYELSTTNRGDLPGYRCDCFTVDPTVTGAGFYGVSTSDYINSGFDRGHMVRSNDREQARGEQATTYFMSNIVPQYAALNQHRWAALETYLQTVADGPTHPEVYIIAGPRGNAGTIGGGHVVIPTATWKVALVLPAGTTPATIDDPSDILDVIAVDMPNQSTLPQDDSWQLHRVSVDSVEKASGYDLLATLADAVECRVEQAITPVANCAPEATLQTTSISGRTVTVAARFRDGETSDAPWKVTIAWGDGTPATTVTSYVQTWTAPLSRAHTYASGGTFTITLTVVDKGGRTTTQTLQVTLP